MEQVIKTLSKDITSPSLINLSEKLVLIKSPCIRRKLIPIQRLTCIDRLNALLMTLIYHDFKINIFWAIFIRCSDSKFALVIHFMLC